MARIIALSNQKGGVGKTTSAINLGAALAEQGRRVLLVDIDPQTSLTDALGIDAGTLQRSIYEVLDSLREQFPGLVATPIRRSIRFAETALAGKPMIEYDPAHPDGEAYRKLAQEVLR